MTKYVLEGKVTESGGSEGAASVAAGVDNKCGLIKFLQLPSYRFQRPAVETAAGAPRNNRAANFITQQTLKRALGFN